jgi:hypothetical protein
MHPPAATTSFERKLVVIALCNYLSHVQSYFMKSLLTLLLVAVAGLTSLQAQSPNPKKLSGVTWLLTADEMSGLGKHSSLDKDIHLEFAADGKWTTTHPLLNNQTKGSWETDKKGRLVLKAGSKTAEIVSLADDKLVIVLDQGTSKVTWTWETAK